MSVRSGALVLVVMAIVPAVVVPVHVVTFIGGGRVGSEKQLLGR
jgi:hypothetical protein